MHHSHPMVWGRAPHRRTRFGYEWQAPIRSTVNDD